MKDDCPSAFNGLVIFSDESTINEVQLACWVMEKYNVQCYLPRIPAAGFQTGFAPLVAYILYRSDEDFENLRHHLQTGYNCKVVSYRELLRDTR